LSLFHVIDLPFLVCFPFFSLRLLFLLGITKEVGVCIALEAALYASLYETFPICFLTFVVGLDSNLFNFLFFSWWHKAFFRVLLPELVTSWVRLFAMFPYAESRLV